MNASRKIFLFKLKWFLYEGLTSVFDFLLYLVHFPAAGCSRLKRNNKKIIIYLGEQLLPRIPRIAKWVKRKSNFSVVLVCSKKGFFEKFTSGEFDAVFLFRNRFHMKRIIRQIPNVELMHAFAPKSYYPGIARKTLKVPFVLDMQDVYSVYYGLNPSLRWLKKELLCEKELLSKADGIVAHSLEPNVALRKYGIRKKPRTLFFPLYCDDDVFQNNAKPLDPDNIHLVYAGGVAGSHRDPRQYGNIQFHEIIKILAEQKIHFHIYPSPSNIPADYEEYKKIARQNEYFHLHGPVGQEELSKELSKYHFGLLPFFKERSEQSDVKLKYATTLKLFNYLEAGIPVIVSKDIYFQQWVIERIHCGFSLSEFYELKNIRHYIQEMDYAELRNKIYFQRMYGSLGKNITRLLTFYSSLLSKKKSYSSG